MSEPAECSWTTTYLVIKFIEFIDEVEDVVKLIADLNENKDKYFIRNALKYLCDENDEQLQRLIQNKMRRIKNNPVCLNLAFVS